MDKELFFHLLQSETRKNLHLAHEVPKTVPWHQRAAPVEDINHEVLKTWAREIDAVSEPKGDLWVVITIENATITVKFYVLPQSAL